VTDFDQDDQADAQAPPVVAAVITRDPGPWLDDCLASLAAQDYPNLSVLVLASEVGDDILGRVAAVLPSAYVRRLEGEPGFGPAANEVLGMVEGAAFYAFLHDDVRLEPTALRALVEEAYRSNAGVVGPKLVHWDRVDRLEAVGINVDKFGVRSPVVEPDELDQEQHDAVRDVFLLPSSCVLVRADLFATLGGFDPAIDRAGEDLDLCWRAQVAGARVVVVPAARVEHRGGAEAAPQEVDDRHRLRTVLTCYGRFHRWRVVPQLVALSIIDVVHGFATGSRAEARAHVRAWRWNRKRRREIRGRRAALHAIRQLPDSEVRRLQYGGSVQATRVLRGELHVTERLRVFSDLGHELSESLHRGPRRTPVLAWAALVTVFLVGSRGLLFHRIPIVGSFAPFDASPGHLLADFVRTSRHAAIGGEASQPTAFALLGLAGIPFLGAMGLLQQVLVLGCLPAGWIGAWLVTKPLGSRLGRSAGLIVYAVVPLGYGALGRGSWSGLVAYAVAPWIFKRLIAACGDLPSAHGPVIRRRDLRAVLALGLLVALVVALVPLFAVVVVLTALGLLVGGALTGGGRRAWGAVTVAIGAVVVAAVLHVPWTLGFVLPGTDWWSLGGVGPVVHQGLGMGALLRFDTGAGHVAFGWALPLAALLPLLIGRDWRFAWAVRCWCVAVVCWAVAWTGGQGLLGVPVPPADVLLAPGAAALSLSVALGVLAFERDLRGYHFGWRQVASLVAAGAVVVSIGPALVNALDGRWDLPSIDHGTTLAFMQDRDVRAEGRFRVLWLGAPELLPVAPMRLADDVAYGIDENGTQSLTERWAAPADGSLPIVADDLRLAGRGDTARLGGLLREQGIRYVVAVERAAPARVVSERVPVPAGLRDALARQLDLRRIDVDPSMVVYENTAWRPAHAGATSRSVARLLAVLLQAILWAAVVGYLVVRRSRRPELIG
jgi:GT2 family glycosyltransferase